MDKVWYYMTAANRKKYGPYDDQELIALIRQEILLANDADKAAGTGDMLVRSTAPGGWIGIAGADFGQEGAGGV